MIIGADSTDAVPVNPLWTFSLALYTKEGVADICLDLHRKRDSVGDERAAREAVLKAELALERVQQYRMWEARSPAGDWPGTAAKPPLRSNLAAVAGHYDIEESELEALASALQHLLPLLPAEL